MRSFPRPPVQLSQSVQNRLNMYALAAGAAGVGVLILPSSATAEVIYTKTHQVIQGNGMYPLDLNHDGTIDFVIEHVGPYASEDALFVKPAFSNGALVSHYLAVALNKGAPIGSKRHFRNTNYSYGDLMLVAGCSDTGCGTVGDWADVNNRYLGLKFQISGATHYGWARLSVQLSGHIITATLTGYAYESVPGQQIYAGQTESTSRNRIGTALKGPAASLTTRSPQSSPLAQLALGVAKTVDRSQP
jgi:hypothetical protein